MIREALDYQDLYHRETRSTPERKGARVEQVLKEIATSGVYKLTFHELQFGVGLAWREGCVR